MNPITARPITAVSNMPIPALLSSPRLVSDCAQRTARGALAHRRTGGTRTDAALHPRMEAVRAPSSRVRYHHRQTWQTVQACLPQLRKGKAVPTTPVPQPGPTTGDASWFVRDRFGLFIHWGLYAMPARHE